MANAIEVSDSLSNTEEQIERAAKIVGRGEVRRKVFEAIYYHKGVKSVTAIMERTGLKRIPVLQSGRHLVKYGIARATTRDGEIAYEMIDFIQAHKRDILKYAARPKQLARLPTKRKGPAHDTVTVNVHLTARPKAVALTIEQIDSFSAVKRVRPDGYISRTISEDQFKRGVQAVLRERAEWNDWGGELADLVSTRVVWHGRRIGTVFAFKGPGQRGPLVPGKMGKNGDQIPRMFLLPGILHVVQYVGEVKPSIYDLMRSLAVAKSVATGGTIYYAVIDGIDSNRLIRAYPDEFRSGDKPGATRRSPAA